MRWSIAAGLAVAGCLLGGPSAAETLERSAVLRDVIAGHETAAIASARIAESRALRRGALAGLLPHLAVAGSGSWNHKEVAFDDRVVRPQWDWGASATMSITLFDGPLYPAYARTRRLVDAARAEAAWATHLLRWEAELAYETLAAAQEEVALAERAVVLRQEQLAVVEQRLAGGVALSVDAARARASVLAARRIVLDAERRRAHAADALRVLLGRPSGESVVAAAPQAPPRPPTQGPGSPRELGSVLTRRPDFLALGEKLAATAAEADVVWWDFLPRVELSGRLALGPPSLGSPDGVTFAVTLAATWTLYDGGARYAGLDAAAARLDAAELELSRVSREAQAEIGVALRDWEAGLTDAELARAQVATQTEVLAAASERFDRGVATSLEVGDAQQRLLEAQLAVHKAELEVRLAAVRHRYLSEVVPDRSPEDLP